MMRRMDQDPISKKLLEQNKTWVAEQLSQHPEYFHNLATGQQPHSLSGLAARTVGCLRM